MKIIVALILLANVAGVIALWKRDKAVLYVFLSFSLLVLFGLTTYEDFTPQWRDYQRQYRDMLVSIETDPVKKQEAARFPIEIRQIWNDELGIADRCTSCHLGVDNPNMKDAPQPFSYHEAAHIMDDGTIIHRFNNVGCTVCHQGQGRATNEKEAHARGIPHWEHPMYPTGEWSMVQASCSQCHEELTRPEDYGFLPGAEMIMDARDFAAGQNELEIRCDFCHTIYGIGEVVAPDLSGYGETTEHEFEGTHMMKYVEGEKTKYSWTFQHFIDPKKITPDDPEHGIEETIMPNFNMSEEMAHKLTVWVYSMRESDIPVKYRYRPEVKELAEKRGQVQQQIAGLYTPEEYAKLSEGEKLFLKYNCWVCHTIHGKGGKIGPDLSKVGKRRKDEWMVKHFKDPRSVSQKSFMPQFNLNEDQIAELVEYLKTLQ
ncbi:MAG: c-type cytochrome [Candidatus Nitrospinota bacterium M3_3B_026]